MLTFNYLLSSSHPAGKYKSYFFNAIGYAKNDWRQLEEDIRSLLENDVSIGDKTECGQKYEIIGDIQSPSGRVVQIITIWIILNGENFPKFVTAYSKG